MNQPESGALVTELTLDGTPTRTFGTLRPTGHESDRDLHLALNGGLPLVDPTGGFYFVFQAGVPLFRKYDARGQLVFERHIEGPRSTSTCARCRRRGRRRRTDDGDVMPLVPPAVRTAGVDSSGQSLDLADGAVHLRLRQRRRQDPHGAVQGRRHAGAQQPVLHQGRPCLVTPGCYEFRTES